MEFRNIITFLRAAELHSFTKAAEDLGYAQSTVTFHIQQLEDEIGVLLFDRIGKKISLTPAGNKLIGYANQMVQLEYEVHQIGGEIEALPGTLRIGIIESLFSTYVAKQLPLYHQRFPRIAIEVKTAASADLLRMLRNNEIDVALIFSKRTVDPDLVRVFQKSDPLLFVTSTRNPLLQKESVSFFEIASQPLILPERVSIYRQAAEDIAAQFDCIFAPVIQVDNTNVILHLITEGFGISFLPRYLVAPQLDRGELAALNMQPFHLDPYYIQILHHKSKYVTPQMRGFIALVQPLL